MPASLVVCPACGAELLYDPSRGSNPACPYDDVPLAEARSQHDRIYFGKWRGCAATDNDVKRAYHQLGRHLACLSDAVESVDAPAARRDLGKAIEALRSADPSDESPDTIRFMDHALSYAHRVVDGLLHERGLPGHSPMDFAEWYDAVDVPFRDEF